MLVGQLLALSYLSRLYGPPPGATPLGKVSAVYIGLFLGVGVVGTLVLPAAALGLARTPIFDKLANGHTARPHAPNPCASPPTTGGCRMAVAAAGAEGRSARGARPIEDPPSPDDERSSQGVWDDEPTHKTATARGKLSMRPCPEQKDAGLPPASLQEAASCEYDRSRYPFAELVAEALGLSDIADLSTLHDTKEGRKAQANPPRAGQCSFRRRWRAWLDSEPGAQVRLHALVRKFVEEEVVRQFGEPAVYQAEPTLRVHIAGTGRALGVPHVDADYFHQPAELNYWLPLTPCWGSNTLWCESRRGGGDYAPIEMGGAGSFRRFWGNQLRHYTLPNATDSTRVSFDLRCVPLSLFVQNWRSPKGNVPFALGFYYRSTAALEAAQGAAARRSARAAAQGRGAPAADAEAWQGHDGWQEEDPWRAREAGEGGRAEPLGETGREQRTGGTGARQAGAPPAASELVGGGARGKGGKREHDGRRSAGKGGGGGGGEGNGGGNGGGSPSSSSGSDDESGGSDSGGSVETA